MDPDAKVNRLRRNENSDLGAKRDHRADLNATNTFVRVCASAPAGTRTVAPEIAISMRSVRLSGSEGAMPSSLPAIQPSRPRSRLWRRRSVSHRLPGFASPNIQEAAADAVSPRDVRNARIRAEALRNNARLFGVAPIAPPPRARDHFNPLVRGALISVLMHGFKKLAQVRPKASLNYSNENRHVGASCRLHLNGVSNAHALPTDICGARSGRFRSRLPRSPSRVQSRRFLLLSGTSPR